MMRPLEPKSPGNKIIADELRLLARVSAALSEISGQSVGAPNFDAELIDLRDQIAEAKPEDLAALVEQMTRISAVAQRYGKGRDLPLDPNVPYFAHMRLNEDERKRDVLIGKRGFIDRDRHVQIVDWRNAPVSRIYYCYDEQDDYEEEFGERVAEGTVEVRRNISIDQGQLRRVGCPQGTFVANGENTWLEGDPAPVAELRGGQGKAARPPKLKRGNRRSRLGEHDQLPLRADKHLPEIAALIDPTQFRLITQPDSGLVVLQGGAGTGKTTVALHRVAYLTYQRPKMFRSERILVVLPSEAMVRYVERVLPSLGVRGVQVITARSWFQRTRRRVLPQLTKHYHDDCPPAVARFKKHPLLLRLLQEHVSQQVSDCERRLQELVTAHPQLSLGLDSWRSASDKALIPRLHVVKQALSTAEMTASVRQTADGALRALIRRAVDIPTDWAEILTNRELLADAVSRLGPGEFSARDLDQVCRWCTRQSDDICSGDTDDEDQQHVAVDGRIETEHDLPGRLDPADDPLLLHLVQLKRGQIRSAKTKPIDYAHLVVDEAQDLSAIEIKVLVRTTSPHHSVTLAGDTAQRLVFDNDFSSWESLLARLDMPVATNSTLKLGYRSTQEVMTLARGLLEDDSALPPQESMRSGAPVELHRFNDQGEAVGMVAEALRSLVQREPLASTILITRHASQARMYADALVRAEVPNLRLVRQQDFSFRPGIEVADVAQVKGLEFDYVVLLDVTAGNYPDSQESRHLLHIAATRAAHQLWLISVGSPSPLLPPTL